MKRQDPSVTTLRGIRWCSGLSILVLILVFQLWYIYKFRQTASNSTMTTKTKVTFRNSNGYFDKEEALRQFKKVTKPTTSSRATKIPLLVSTRSFDTVEREKIPRASAHNTDSKGVIDVRSPSPNLSGRTTRTTTEAGVDLSDPELYQSIVVHQKTLGQQRLQNVVHNHDVVHHLSSTATVMGVATGYPRRIYEQFVGSLRKAGFDGNIILGISADNVKEGVVPYLKYRNVTIKYIQWRNCTYQSKFFRKKGKVTCARPYPDIKLRWSRYPLMRDWLLECSYCTGPVLIMDVRDSYFQRNPFEASDVDGNGLIIQGLEVFEENKLQTTAHWLTRHPFQECKGITTITNETMLCSGSTVGTRPAMLRYLQAMYEEMKVWISDVQHCHFDFHGDDQSIHNYLYYTGQLPFANTIANRHGIVNTVGKHGAMMAKEHFQRMHEQYGLDKKQAKEIPYLGSSGNRWVPSDAKYHDLIDDEGYLLDIDGSRSRVIHQFDRFHSMFKNTWMKNHSELFHDPMPIDK